MSPIIGTDGFHSSSNARVRHSDDDDEEYITMLVPSTALDWGPSTLAVNAALNATTGTAGGDKGGSGGAWVEIDCHILGARLVQDVTFSG